MIVALYATHQLHYPIINSSPPLNIPVLPTSEEVNTGTIASNDTFHDEDVMVERNQHLQSGGGGMVIWLIYSLHKHPLIDWLASWLKHWLSG